MKDIIRNLFLYRDEALSGYIVLIDKKKAFDHLNYTYLLHTMKIIGIDGNFLLVKDLYTDITSQVMVNGALTNKINIARGVRQGCPLSMILYTIGSTPLKEMIKAERRITGHITKLMHPIKVLSYADDMTVIIKRPDELHMSLKY